jgi:HSP20 family protein
VVIPGMLPFDPFAPLSTIVGPPLRAVAFVPPVDVAVSDSDVVLTMDVPGLTSEDISLEVIDGLLTVRGERRRDAAPEGTAFAHVERGVGRFERSVRLPDGVDPDSLTASLENGVLSLIVPKPEHKRPRTIQIETGERAKELAA